MSKFCWNKDRSKLKSNDIELFVITKKASILSIVEIHVWKVWASNKQPGLAPTAAE